MHHLILFKININTQNKMCVSGTRSIVSIISLCFTRPKIRFIARIIIKSNVFCMCMYNGNYYTLLHRITKVYFCLSTFLIFFITIYVGVISCPVQKCKIRYRNTLHNSHNSCYDNVMILNVTIYCE